MSKQRGLRYLLPGVLAVGAVGFVVARASRPPLGNPRVPEPAKPVDLDRYLGHWYELARYDVGFERRCEGVTADYASRPDGLIDVVNTCRRGAPDGPVHAARARARVVPNSGGAKLKVAFFGPFFVGDYWVLDHADDYAWSIVGEPSGRYLWILARDPLPPQDARSALVARVRDMGYDTGLLRFTRQPPG
jgi:apolipoprotein D and lipocalin family protein